MSLDRLERRLPEVLTELSLPRMPDYVDDLLGRTARTPQRPGWTFLERWFPLTAITADLQAPRRFSPRLLLVVALLLVALVLASIAVYIGTQTKLPPLFGPARNGLVVTAADGDIVTIDPATGASSTLVAGDDLCCVEVSPDGQRVVALHVRPGAVYPSGMTVVRMDGSLVRDIPSSDLPGLNWFSWSPTGDRLVLASSTAVATVDLATGELSPLEIPFAVDTAEWIGTTGDILLTSRAGHQAPMYVYRLTPGAPGGPTDIPIQYAVDAPSVSPDGTRLAYFIWGPEEWLHGRVHVYDLATGVDTAITPEDEASNADPHSVEGVQWSPDGSLIASGWFWTDFEQLGIVPATGGAPVYVGPRLSPGGLSADDIVMFSPDGESLLVQYANDGTTWLLPVDGSPGRQVPWTIGEEVDWQRLAP